MAEVINIPVDSLDRRRGGDRKDNNNNNNNNRQFPSSDDPNSSPPAPPPPRRRDRDSRERRDRDYYDRNRSPPPPPPRERDYKRRSSISPPPPPLNYMDRRHSPPPRRSPPYKRSRREDGGYEGRRGSPRGGLGPGDRRFGYDYGGGYDREMMGRPGYPEERPHGRYFGRSSGGYQDWDSGRGSYGDASNSGSTQREGLMSYKQFIQELEDDILPAEAECRYQEYKSEYISTQKRAFFDAHKDEEWLRDKYHPTNLVTVIERRNELAQKVAKDFLLDLQSGTLDLSPGVNALSSNKSGQTSEPNSEDEADIGGKRRRHGRGPAKETDLLSAAPKAHPVSSDPRRIQIDIGQAQGLVRKLDSEKGIEENILRGSDNDKINRDKSHGSLTGLVIIVRGLTSVKGLEGVELLDTLITYLWRVHGLDYYGMIETSEAKGLRHVRAEGKSSDVTCNGSEWEKKLDSHWQERLRGQDPLELCVCDLDPEKKNVSSDKKSVKKKNKNQTQGAKHRSRLQLDPGASAKSSPKSKSSQEKTPAEKLYEKNARKPSAASSPLRKQRNVALLGAKFQNGNGDSLEEGLENPDLGPFLLKQTRDMMSSGENPQKALELALRATKSFEKCADGKPSPELVMSLHVLAALYCNLGQYNEAIPVLERSIEIPVIDDGHIHALAKFAGCMQLGDTYAMLGQIENSILFYTAGLEIQRQVLGETDPRVGETCRYVAEAHVQALQFDEAERLCQMALDIHRENGAPASIEEAADRRLMGLICDSKGDYESALEHYVLASMAMAAHDHEVDVASIDCSIGDAYLSLARYDEAIFAYQKALTAFKSGKGENHPAVASVFIRLADLYNKIGKLRDSRTYCENALRIYGKPNPGIPSEEIASGLIDIAAIYQSMNELDKALKLLKKALTIFGQAPGQQSTIAGIEAQMGVMYYMIGSYTESYSTFKSAISKLRASGEKKSALFGIALNQMGLACVQRYAINEAADLFEEARSILEKEYGPYHPDTLAVYSNLAGTYDAMGRLDDAIEILDYVVDMREEKLGTANPDVIDEKRRLGELLKEAGRVRSRKSRSLVTLLDTSTQIIKDEGIKVS